jgi:cytochrome P450
MHRRAEQAILQNEDKDTLLDDDSVPTVWQSILSSKLPPAEKTRNRMAQEGFIIIVAGSDTISRILTRATFHILDDKKVLQRLMEELKEAIPNLNMDIDVASLEKLPWLASTFQIYHTEL